MTQARVPHPVRSGLMKVRSDADLAKVGPMATSSYYATWWMTGLGCRRRSCQAAICFGEAHGAFDPKIAEWDFPNPSGSIRKDGERPELKHLSKGRKRNQMR